MSWWLRQHHPSFDGGGGGAPIHIWQIAEKDSDVREWRALSDPASPSINGAQYDLAMMEKSTGTR
jgi:hypothetical protein